MSRLDSKIAALAEKAKARPKAEAAPQAQPVPAKVVQLPLWPEAVRCVPNSVLRSALFGAIKRGARAYLERVQIHAQEGITIRYTGPRLDQGDLDVWATVLHAVRDQALGTECHVTAYQLLKTLGKSDTGGNRKVLDKRLSRMNATALYVKVGRYSYEGSLIAGVERDELTKAYIIRLDPKLSSLFAADQFTQVEWQVRHALEGQQLAQWLHGYYSSHAKPFPVRAETLLELSGSSDASATSGRQSLRKALNAVAEACKANGEKFSYRLEDGLVHVTRTPSRSQQKHLNKRARKPR